MIQHPAAGVDLGVSVLARPNHPARLATMFAASIGASVVIAMAAYALVWMAQDMRGAHDAPAATLDTVPNIAVPNGVVVVQKAKDAREFEKLTGFAPFVPATLPRHTTPGPSFAVTLPDDNGRRVGRVAFAAEPGAQDQGIGGPLLVLIEAPGAPGAGVDGLLKQSATGGRMLVATIACRGLVIDAQMYFTPPAAVGEPAITPYMLDVGQRYLASLNEECAE